jgi:hypothetical protein
MKELLKKLVGTEPPTMVLAMVKAVDEAAATCDCEPLDDSAELFGVALRSIADNSTTGVVVYPKVESIVLVAVLNHATGSTVVVEYSEVEKILIIIGSMKFCIKDGAMYLGSDAATGEKAVLGNTLKTDLGSICDRIDQLYALLQNPAFAASVAAAIGDGGTTYNSMAQPILSAAPPRPVLNILSQNIELK